MEEQYACRALMNGLVSNEALISRTAQLDITRRDNERTHPVIDFSYRQTSSRNIPSIVSSSLIMVPLRRHPFFS